MKVWNIVTALGAALLLVLLALAGTAMSDANFFGVSKPVEMPTLLLVLMAATTGASLGAGLAMRSATGKKLRDLAYPLLLSVLCAAAGLLLIAAVSRGQLTGLRAAVALVLAMLALVAGIRCIDLIGQGYPLGFESYWGGLGGSGGGWKILPPTGLTILALSLAGASVALVSLAEPVPPKHKPDVTEAAGDRSKAAPPSTDSRHANQAAPLTNTSARQ